MPRASHPATPRQELDSRRHWLGREIAGGVLTPELAQFCQSGVSVVLGARNVDGHPIAGLALACGVNASGVVRVLLREPANDGLLQALDAGAGIAATFSEPRTHRSIQLKAGSARKVQVTEDDLASVARQCATLKRELEFAGYSAELTTYYCAYRAEEIVAVEFVPEEAFVQTPGPGAGSALTQ
jgi:hypothetical protein